MSPNVSGVAQCLNPPQPRLMPTTRRPRPTSRQHRPVRRSRQQQSVRRSRSLCAEPAGPADGTASRPCRATGFGGMSPPRSSRSWPGPPPGCCTCPRCGRRPGSPRHRCRRRVRRGHRRPTAGQPDRRRVPDHRRVGVRWSGRGRGPARVPLRSRADRRRQDRPVAAEPCRTRRSGPGLGEHKPGHPRARTRRHQGAVHGQLVRPPGRRGLLHRDAVPPAHHRDDLRAAVRRPDRRPVPAAPGYRFDDENLPTGVSARRTRAAPSRWPTPVRAPTAASSSSCTGTATSTPNYPVFGRVTGGLESSTGGRRRRGQQRRPHRRPRWSSSRSRRAEHINRSAWLTPAALRGPARSAQRCSSASASLVAQRAAVQPQLLEVPPRLPDERPGRHAEQLHDRVAVEVRPDPGQVLLGLQPGDPLLERVVVGGERGGLAPVAGRARRTGSACAAAAAGRRRRSRTGAPPSRSTRPGRTRRSAGAARPARPRRRSRPSGNCSASIRCLVSRAPTTSWWWKLTRPSGPTALVAGLPTSCISAAKRSAKSGPSVLQRDRVAHHRERVLVHVLVLGVLVDLQAQPGQLGQELVGEPGVDQQPQPGHRVGAAASA